VKARIRASDLIALETLARRALEMEGAAEVRALDEEPA
jgi:phosphocarrier protein FPr